MGVRDVGGNFPRQPLGVGHCYGPRRGCARGCRNSSPAAAGCRRCCSVGELDALSRQSKAIQSPSVLCEDFGKDRFQRSLGFLRG